MRARGNFHGGSKRGRGSALPRGRTAAALADAVAVGAQVIVRALTGAYDTRLHWVTEIGGEKRERDAEITEQRPDHRIACKALDQEGPNGVVTFHKLDGSRTRVMVRMDYEPEGTKESPTASEPIATAVKGDLESFKEFVESRGSETAAWCGEIEN